jgi:hypothetical protein
MRADVNIASLAVLLLMVSCKEGQQEASRSVPSASEAWLLRVGSEVITEADLEHHLKGKYDGRSDEATRNLALDELARRAQYVQAAADADLVSDAVVRAEVARILKSRFREEMLFSKVKSLVGKPVSEEQLRELYEAQKSRFQSNEKRQVAVLWLDPGSNPERLSDYQKKLEGARTWVRDHADLKKAPEKGFAVLSVDHSEHAASRFKGGVVGWMEEGGGMDKWSKAVAEIAFGLESPGALSEVVTRDEGLFLVRYMDLKPAVVRSFETVKGDLGQALKKKRRETLEAEFEEELSTNYPVERRDPK